MINYIYQLVSPKVFSVKYEDISFDKSVIIKPKYMAVCHADQRYYLGSRDISVLRKKLPMALIHECCGEVLYDGSNQFTKGQKVVLIPNSPTRIDDVIYENYSKGARFLSSGYDGFMREFISMPQDRIVPFDNIQMQIAAICEFVSVGVHAVERFKKIAHKRRDNIVVLGDGSLSYIVSSILKYEFPNSKITVVGKDIRKLSYFSFVDKTYLSDCVDKAYEPDHAFECAGGEGSYYAIDDIIRYINPQGTVMLLGVSENKVSINTRDILEKGLTFIGSSRSGYSDFKKAVSLMENKDFQERLANIIYEDKEVKNIDDIHRVFSTDLNTPFKTTFKWGL